MSGASRSSRVCEAATSDSATSDSPSASTSSTTAASSPPPPTARPFYDRDFTRGGSIVTDAISGREEYVPYCACALVAVSTAFMSASTCLDSWAALPSGACQPPPATGSPSALSAPTPAPDATDAQLEHYGGILAQEPSPQLVIAIKTRGLSGACEQLSSLDAMLRRTLCSLMQQAYSQLGYPTAGVCNHSAAEVLYERTALTGAAGPAAGSEACQGQDVVTGGVPMMGAIPPPAGMPDTLAPHPLALHTDWRTCLRTYSRARLLAYRTHPCSLARPPLLPTARPCIIQRAHGRAGARMRVHARHATYCACALHMHNVHMRIVRVHVHAHVQHNMLACMHIWHAHAHARHAHVAGSDRCLPSDSRRRQGRRRGSSLAAAAAAALAAAAAVAAAAAGLARGSEIASSRR